jgi:hypothetical protein
MNDYELIERLNSVMDQAKFIRNGLLYSNRSPFIEKEIDILFEMVKMIKENKR